ncbi:MAG: hypothetical protein WCR27_06545 [Eubacteriales bacterium]
MNPQLAIQGSQLLKKFGPILMRQLGPHLTKRISPILTEKVGIPLAKKVGLPLARRVGIPLARRTGSLLIKKIGYPLANKITSNMKLNQSSADKNKINLSPKYNKDTDVSKKLQDNSQTIPVLNSKQKKKAKKTRDKKFKFNLNQRNNLLNSNKYTNYNYQPGSNLPSTQNINNTTSNYEFDITSNNTRLFH